MQISQVDAGDPEQIGRRLLARFRETTGRPAVGCFVAPGRVNLVGEHVDYNGGKCLPMALPHATYAALAPREDDVVNVHSLQEEDPWHGRLDGMGPGDATGWPAYVVGVAWALRQRGVDLPGMDVVVDSRVPVGAGLSSSAALECSVALGLCALAGREVDDDLRAELVRACMQAESEVAGAPTGGMDQTIALFAEAEHALLLDCRDWSTRQVPWDPSAQDLALLVVDTRASHSLTDGGYQSRREQCEQAARVLDVDLLRDVDDPEEALGRLEDELVRRRARHVFTEMARVDRAVEQLEALDYEGVGATFVASHESLRDDFEVSCPELDAVVETALDNGALGARMTGGGFGGSAIALVAVDRVEGLSTAVAEEFSRRGWDAPAFLSAVPSEGARRLE
jgi:galactokinase